MNDRQKFSLGTPPRKGDVKRPLTRRMPQSELEFAVTILLVELASSDEGFAPSEYNTIMMGLKRVFGTERQVVQAHINRAVTTLQNLRGTSEYAKTLREHLTKTQLASVMEAVDDVINADGVQDGFEIYHRNRFAKLLGLDVPPLVVPDESTE